VVLELELGFLGTSPVIGEVFLFPDRDVELELELEVLLLEEDLTQLFSQRNTGKLPLIKHLHKMHLLSCI
jgi:hypothetical protein